MAVYLCGICKTQLESVPKWYHEESIGRDKCPLWFHLKCVEFQPQIFHLQKASGTAHNPSNNGNNGYSNCK